MTVTETLLALGTSWNPLQHEGELPEPEVEPVHYPLAIRLNLMAKYLDIFRISSNSRDLDAVAHGGVGRIVNDEAKGLTCLRQHAALWSALRKKISAFVKYYCDGP